MLLFWTITFQAPDQTAGEVSLMLPLNWCNETRTKSEPEQTRRRYKCFFMRWITVMWSHLDRNKEATPSSERHKRHVVDSFVKEMKRGSPVRKGWLFFLYFVFKEFTCNFNFCISLCAEWFSRWPNWRVATPCFLMWYRRYATQISLSGPETQTAVLD